MMRASKGVLPIAEVVGLIFQFLERTRAAGKPIVIKLRSRLCYAKSAVS